MNENEILKLLGKPESDKEVQLLLAEYNFSLEKPKYFVESFYGDGLNVGFRVKFSYDVIYNGVKSNVSEKTPFTEYTPEHEWILEEITFNRQFPFGLSTESTKADVKKLGTVYKKPRKALWFLIKDDYDVYINFNEGNVSHVTVKKQSLFLIESLKEKRIVNE